jgi:hypothetical protein
MKKSVKLQIFTAVVLVVIAALDAVSIFIPVAAVAALALILFKPKWLLTYFQDLYGKND